jgi:hypothetical protein
LVEELLTKNMTTSCNSSQPIAVTQHYSEILPKKRNNAEKKSSARWRGVRSMIQRKFLRANHASGNVRHSLTSPTNKNIHLNMIDSHRREPKPNNIQRPRNLNVSPIVVNRQLKASPVVESEKIAVIRETPKIVTSKSATLNSKQSESSENFNLKRQHSLEVFRDVFGPPKGSLERLRTVHQRIKTPGDVPPSVRKIRASKTLSLYDDRMMDSTQSFDGSSNSM